MAQVVRRLEDLNYLDDREYLRRRAQLLAGRGYADSAVLWQLIQSGAPDEMAQAAVAAIPDELAEKDRILKIIEKKKDKEREKLIRYLAGRGFAFDLILRTIDGDEI